MIPPNAQTTTMTTSTITTTGGQQPRERGCGQREHRCDDSDMGNESKQQRRRCEPKNVLARRSQALSAYSGVPLKIPRQRLARTRGSGAPVGAVVQVRVGPAGHGGRNGPCLEFGASREGATTMFPAEERPRSSTGARRGTPR
jgi:hypothetical protein